MPGERGFWVSPDGTQYVYEPNKSNPVYHNPNTHWVPFDQAPQAWQDRINRLDGTPGNPTQPPPENPGGGPATGFPPNQTGYTNESSPNYGPNTGGSGMDASGVLEWIKNNPWVIPAALAAYQGYKGSQAEGQANAARDEALALARQQWEERAPLRQRFLSESMNPPSDTPDLTSTFADPTNPFYTAMHPGNPKQGLSDLANKMAATKGGNIPSTTPPVPITSTIGDPTPHIRPTGDPGAAIADLIRRKQLPKVY